MVASPAAQASTGMPTISHSTGDNRRAAALTAAGPVSTGARTGAARRKDKARIVDRTACRAHVAHGPGGLSINDRTALPPPQKVERVAMGTMGSPAVAVETAGVAPDG